jgi:hypothetical protein
MLCVRFWGIPLPCSHSFTNQKVKCGLNNAVLCHAGGEPVEINAGDFVHFPPGETQFKVTKPVRKFFTLV